MIITYIGHSGFLIEWEDCYWLFDYYQGSIPELDARKALLVFASHKHGDHYNPEIFKLQRPNQKVIYVLSSDIRRKEDMPDIISVTPSTEYELVDGRQNKIRLRTLKSTDCGVAFLLSYQGRTIYHAGDLNLWVWKEETKQYNNNMTANFMKEMKVLKGRDIDVAFVPLDPRLKETYAAGLDELLTAANVRYVFPMHCWENYEIILQYKREHERKPETRIMDIVKGGQQWCLEL